MAQEVIVPANPSNQYQNGSLRVSTLDGGVIDGTVFDIDGIDERLESRNILTGNIFVSATQPGNGRGIAWLNISDDSLNICDGTTWITIGQGTYTAPAGSGLNALSEDPAPRLGANLNANNKRIYGVGAPTALTDAIRLTDLQGASGVLRNLVVATSGWNKDYADGVGVAANSYANGVGINSISFATSASGCLQGQINNLPQGSTGSTDGRWAKGGRLTISSGNPIPIVDVSGTTIYFTPYKGSQIGLLNGSTWSAVEFADTPISMPNTANQNYDLFGYYNAGHLGLEWSAAWASDIARTDAVAMVSGVYVKSSNVTRRLLGSVRTIGVSGYTEFSPSGSTGSPKLYVASVDNPVQVHGCRKIPDNSWTYSTATYRATNNDTNNRVCFVQPITGNSVNSTISVLCSQTSNANVSVGIGINSTTVNSAEIMGQAGRSAGNDMISASHGGTFTPGYHYIQGLEYSSALGTSSWYGNANTIYIQSSIIVDLWC